MYRQLLQADVVIADLSTYNPNAFYELGVRHALRPFTTIIISEDQLKYPFDVNHTAIRSYEHLGKDIGYGEVMRFRKVLEEALTAILAKQERDSPVYTYLHQLNPPSMGKPAEALSEAPAGSAPTPTPEEPTIAMLMDQMKAAKAKEDFITAKTLLNILHGMKPKDEYLIQQLTLATYKSKRPTAEEALREAHKTLSVLDPSTSADPETLGLWGAIHKRLYELTAVPADLDTSIFAYEKGFYLKNDYYNGINLAGDG